VYAQKQPDDKKKEGGHYGDGKREQRNRNDNRKGGHGNQKDKEASPIKKVDYEPIEEQEMASALKSNFEQYCMDYQNAQEEESEAREEHTEKAKDKKPDCELYQKLANVNGKKGDEVVASFLSSVFDEDTRKIEQHLTRYFDLLLADGVLKGSDINHGLSRFSDQLPELVLDCPQIHKYLMDYVIRPLREKNIVQYKHISWKFQKTKKDEDEDDDIIFGTNPFFKLVALILVDMLQNGTNKNQIGQDLDKQLHWRSVLDEKHAHIEDADHLWKEIKDEAGSDYADIVIPILNRTSDPAAMDAQLQQALKK